MRDDIRLAIAIPAAAALVTGALVFVLVCALAAWRGWPVVYAPITAAAAALVSWLVWSARFANLVEYRLAPNRPKAVPDITPGTVNLHIHRVDDTGNVIEGAFVDDLPISGDRLSRLAALVVNGASLTTSGMMAGGLTRSQWENVRDRLLKAGLLEWRGSRSHGCEPTERGMRVFSKLADIPRATTPTPHPGGSRLDARIRR